MSLKELPIGLQTFEDLQKPNVLYVDKTRYIHDLVRRGKGRYFLSRPRRFGKSLTCSTLAAIFEGRKELFKDLWISQSDYAWKKHPVIYLDFSGIDRKTPEALEKSLKKRLYDFSQKEDVQLDQDFSPQEMLRTIVIALGKKKGPVCIIIDEYDKPIVDHIENPEIAEKMRSALKAFYEMFKDAQVDANVHFLFVTGVSKFSKVSLFSGVNNLDDLTNDDRTDALVGYTDQEVDTYLHGHIQALADKRTEDYATTRMLLKTWYNGYRFSKSPTTVYNPFSLHNCLSKENLDSYWFASGTPDFLIKWIKNNPDVANQIDIVENEKVSSTELDAFNVDTYYKKFKILLLQTGYLTLGDYDEPSANYTVMYPNWEVRRAMTGQVMEFIGHVAQTKFGSFIPKFRNAIETDDIGLF
ncbi:MAG: AAA family ATPase, partial [bacterium]